MCLKIIWGDCSVDPGSVDQRCSPPKTKRQSSICLEKMPWREKVKPPGSEFSGEGEE